MKDAFSLAFLLIFITLHFSAVFCSSDTDILRARTFPPCKACKVLIESFKKGIERTSKGKFEGGDAAWEEQKLGSYANSEVRLVEIQEHLCSDVEEGRDQCYSLNEKYDGDFEDWWFSMQDKDLYVHMCIETMKHCCPDMHFGPICKPCLGYPDNVCSKNGKCKGSGTRKGNGECICESGYSGLNCDTCAESYFIDYKDNKKIMCSKCHIACEKSCTKAGPSGCEKCASGWIMSSDEGCLDVNECTATKPLCKLSQFCVNTEGSYKCLDCDRFCAGCTGDGPDMCINCADGYSLIDNICVDSEQEQRKQYIFFTRYLTYFGLCIATCIIFQKSVSLAAIVGLAVGIYISVSEYMLSTPVTPNVSDFAHKFVGNQN